MAHDVTTRMERDAAVERELRRTYDAVEQLQHTLLPSRLPSVAGVEVAARYEPARATVVGGDWYAVVPLPDGCVGLGIGDVAGHGLVAVEAMASARFSLRALALAEPSASRVLDRLDEAFSLFESDTLMTALYGVLDPTGPTWAFTSAGHCPPVRRAPDGVVSVVQTRAQPPIGMCSRYRHDTVSLSHGDVLVLYTDGLVERRDEPITAGIERLCAALETGPDAPDALVEHLAGTLVDARSNDDDVALMVVRIA